MWEKVKEHQMFFAEKTQSIANSSNTIYELITSGRYKEDFEI